MFCFCNYFHISTMQIYCSCRDFDVFAQQRMDWNGLERICLWIKRLRETLRVKYFAFLLAA
jgi:hypothetical protein